MTEEERRRILDEARATLARPMERYTPKRGGEWKPPAEPEPEPPPRGLDTAPTDWSAVIDGRIASARAAMGAELEATRAFVLEVVAEALGEALADHRKEAAGELADAVRSLRIELLELQTTLCEVRQALAIERGHKSGTVIDMPNPLRRVN
jgi:hypothetical protein